MWATVLIVLAGVSWDHPWRDYSWPVVGRVQPAGEAESVKKMVTVAVKGKVACWRHLRFGLPAVSITAKDGRSYWLDFNGRNDLFKLACYVSSGSGQKTVLVTGIVRPQDQALMADCMWIDADGDVRSAVTVQIRGKLESNALVGCPGVVRPVITADGQRFVLDFGTDKQVRQRAHELDGTPVVLTGIIVGSRTFPVMCLPPDDGETLPVILVTRLQADPRAYQIAEVIGRLEP
jgi:hypothetical protein